MKPIIKQIFQKDDTVTIVYDKEGVYRVTINRTASDGTEYLNEEHSKDALDFYFYRKGFRRKKKQLIYL